MALRPIARFDPRSAPKAYGIEQRLAPVGDWAALAEPHTGSVPAHTVRHLTFGQASPRR
jgi:hypothetical protein